MAGVGKESLTLMELFQMNGVPKEVLEELGEPPFKIQSVKQFANSFETKGEITTLFAAKSGRFREAGDVIANLKQAWREAESHTQRSLKRVAEGMPEEDMDDPLPEGVRLSLQESFTRTYGVMIPMTWTAMPNITGRLHRGFNKREYIPTKVGMVKTLGVVTEAAPLAKRHRMGNEVELIVGATQKAEAIHHTFLYINKLQALMYSMAFAGCYTVSYKDRLGQTKESLQVPLQQCLAHLAAAQNFVVVHSGKSYESVILNNLCRIDETIRNRWAEKFRSSTDPCGSQANAEANPLPLGVIMAETADSFATNLWAADIPQIQKDDKKGLGNSKANTPGKSGKGNAGSPKWSSNNFADQLKGNPKGSGKKGFCKFFNSAGGCSAANCAFKHACSAKKSNGDYCGNKGHGEANLFSPTAPPLNLF